MQLSEKVKKEEKSFLNKKESLGFLLAIWMVAVPVSIVIKVS
jgi:hypothetical protein